MWRRRRQERGWSRWGRRLYLYSLSRDVEEEETGEGGADGDEDWIEPGKISNRRKRDKNSPKRYGMVRNTI